MRRKIKKNSSLSYCYISIIKNVVRYSNANVEWGDCIMSAEKVESSIMISFSQLILVSNAATLWSPDIGCQLSVRIRSSNIVQSIVV